MAARAFFPHEADDPDLDWLITNFLQERPNFIPVEAGALPIVLLPYRGKYEVAKQASGVSPFKSSSVIGNSTTDEASLEEE